MKYIKLQYINLTKYKYDNSFSLGGKKKLQDIVCSLYYAYLLDCHGWWWWLWWWWWGLKVVAGDKGEYIFIRYS